MSKEEDQQKNLADLLKKMHEELSKMHEELSIATKLKERRLELIDLLLGPQFFGNEGFFAYYSLIDGEGQEYGKTTAFHAPNRKVDFMHAYDENDAQQIFIRADNREEVEGHKENVWFRYLALVRNKQSGSIDIYLEEDMGHLFLYHLYKITENIGEKMRKYSAEEIADYPSGKLLFEGILTGMTRMTSFLLEKSKGKLDKKYSDVQQDIKRLRAIAKLKSD